MQVGYAMQSGQFVYGLEADLQDSIAQANAIRAGLPDSTGANYSVWHNSASERLDWLGAVRGRLG